MAKSVFCMARDETQACRIVDLLKSNGFSDNDVSVLLSDKQGTRDFAHEKHTKAPEGAVTGGTSGAVIGGALGWLAGIGALAIPGVGPFIAAGPLMGMLGGIGVGTAVGGITGALIGLGIPEYEARRYEGRINRGGILLSIHCDNSEWARQARAILHQTGAEDVSATGETRADFANSDKPVPRAGAGVAYNRRSDVEA